MGGVWDGIELLRHTLTAYDDAFYNLLYASSNPKPEIWMQLTSSMDALEDAQHAIDAFFADSDVFDSDNPSRTGQKYLRLYGLLQAMFLQQDATRHLVEAVDLGYDPLSDLERDDLAQVRRIRNQSVGHPTKFKRGQDRSHVFVVQMSMAATTFEYLVWREQGGGTESVAVDLADLRVRQETAVERALVDVDEHLQSIGKDYELGDLDWWPG